MALNAPPSPPAGYAQPEHQRRVLNEPLLSRVGPGTYLSPASLFVPPGYNGVAIEATPEGAAPNATLTVVDSVADGSGFTSTVDQNGVAAGMTTQTKRNVGGVRPYVKVLLVVTSGIWTVTGALIAQPSVNTTNVPGNVNITQYGGAGVGPANPLDVRAASGALGTQTVNIGQYAGAAAGPANPLDTRPASGSVQRVSAGFLAPGQTSKSFVGRVLSAANLAVPGVPTLAVGAAGAPNGTYRCAVTFVTATGETSGGTEATVTVVNQRIAWSAIPVGPTGTIARNLYRTLAAGAVGTERFAAQLADNVTTVFTDNVADATIAAAAAMPTLNTSGNVIVALWTVTAAKTLTFTDLMMSTDSAAQMDMRLQAAGADIFRQFMRDLAPIQLPGIETQPNASSGQAVTLVIPGTVAAQSVIFTLEAIEA